MALQIRSRVKRVENRYILYDADTVNAPSSDLFDPQALEEQGRVLGSARGRGETLFLRGNERDWVLRHFRRGGAVARLLGDVYFGLSPKASRAFREWRLLAELYKRGLPVPRPIAACVEQHAFFYRADIVIEKIPDVRSLAQWLEEGPLSEGLWRRIGRCLRRFHDAGCYHADLNAHNILVDKDDRVFLIDFDRGRLRRPGRWSQKNLDRLHRSLQKIDRLSQAARFAPSDWAELLEGYRQKPT